MFSRVHPCRCVRVGCVCVRVRVCVFVCCVPLIPVNAALAAVRAICAAATERPQW